MRRQLSRLGAVLAVVALAAAACGGDNSSSGSSATTAAPAATTGAATTGAATTAASAATTAAAGAATTAASSGPAAGDPIVVGTISNDGNASNSPETSDGIEMGANYLNANGGIAGHPVKVIRCDEAGDAEKHTACARSMIDDKDVLAVIEGTPRQIAIGLPFFEEAKMPVLVPSPPVGPELKSPVSLALTGGNPLALAVFPKYLAEQGKKSASVIAIDAASIPPLVATYDRFLTQNGLDTSKLVQYPASTTDFTPTATAAIADNPDSVLLIVAPSHYGPIVRALRDVGYTGLIISGRAQFNSASLTTAGEAADGNLTVLDIPPEGDVTDPAGKEMYANYNAEVKSRGVSPSGGGLAGFVSMFALKNAMEQIGYDKLSRETVLDLFRNGEIKGVPLLPEVVGLSQAPTDPAFSSLGNPTAYIGELSGQDIKSITDRINPFV